MARSSWWIDFEQAPPLIDRIAPEHLELETRDAEALMGKIRNAGAIFLGRHTPEAIGDYVAGSNHVLPTARSARFSSGLGVLDFMKRTSILRLNERSLAALGPAAMTLASVEGLDAHRRSVAIRLGIGEADHQAEQRQESAPASHGHPVTGDARWRTRRRLSRTCASACWAGRSIRRMTGIGISASPRSRGCGSTRCGGW